MKALRRGGPAGESIVEARAPRDEPRTERTRGVSGSRCRDGFLGSRLPGVPLTALSTASCATHFAMRDVAEAGAPGIVTRRSNSPASGRMALAFFITFSTYGTWLHGTSKGK